MAMDNIILVAHEVGAKGTKECITLDRSPFRVGRKPENEATLVNPDISGVHAIFRYQDGCWWVEDTSKNGTWVNRIRLELGKATAIHPGDDIYFVGKGFRVSREHELSDPAAPMLETIAANTADILGQMELPRILIAGRTVAHFQRIGTIAKNQPVGWECLGRATDENRKPISPGRLFDLAARSKMEVRLSKQFRDSARHCCECHFCWPKNALPYLFINLHSAEITDPKFLSAMTELAATKVATLFRLVIEMPESWIAKTGEMKQLAQQIRGLGMLVAYDDFGQGASRLPDLISVPPDFLKLDRELITKIHSDPVRYSLIQAIVKACHDLKVTTIGEGIETQEELDACEEMGIELGQGYFLERPKPAYEIFQIATASLPTSCPFIRLGLV